MRTIITKIFLFSALALLVVSAESVYAQSTQPNNGTTKSTVIADVGIYGSGIVKSTKRSITVGFGLKSDLGTQAGVHYGINVYTGEGTNRQLVDTYVSNSAVTLQEGLLSYNEITYTPPANIGGMVQVAIIAKTDTGLPLAETIIGPYTFSAGSTSSVSVESCDFSKFNAGIVSCSVKNTTASATSVTFYSELKNHNQFGALVASPFSQAVTLKAKESKTITLSALAAAPGAGDYSLETRIMAKDNSLLVRKIFTTTIAGSAAKISNVFVAQDNNNFTVGVVSLTNTKNGTINIRLEQGTTLCTEKKTAFTYPRTDVAVSTLLRTCTPDTVSVELIGADGASLDKKTIPYTSVVAEQGMNSKGWTLLYGAVGVLGLLVVYNLLKKRRENSMMTSM